MPKKHIQTWKRGPSGKKSKRTGFQQSGYAREAKQPTTLPDTAGIPWIGQGRPTRKRRD